MILQIRKQPKRVSGLQKVMGFKLAQKPTHTPESLLSTLFAIPYFLKSSLGFLQ